MFTIVRTGARTSTLVPELVVHGRRATGGAGHLDAGGLGAVGLEDDEEKCCTARGATRLNLEGQTATGSVRMPFMKGERMHLWSYCRLDLSDPQDNFGDFEDIWVACLLCLLLPLC